MKISKTESSTEVKYAFLRHLLLILALILLAFIKLSQGAVPPDSLEIKAPVFVFHLVEKGETLDGISSRYGTNRASLLSLNPTVVDQSLEPGQVIKVATTGNAPAAPAKKEVMPSKPAAKPIIDDQASVIIVEQEDLRADFEGIENGQEVYQRGMATWNQSIAGESLVAYHKTAPKGTILRITNPQTGQAVYVRVVGPWTDSDTASEEILRLSSGAAKLIGADNGKVLVDVAYHKVSQ
jgi:LysM repeat protein